MIELLYFRPLFYRTLIIEIVNFEMVRSISTVVIFTILLLIKKIWINDVMFTVTSKITYYREITLIHNDKLPLPAPCLTI